LVFGLCLAFLLGVGLAHSGVLIGFSWAAVAGVPALIFARRRTIVSLIFIILFGLSLGWWRGGIYMQKLAAYDNLFGQKVTISVEANDDATYNDYSQLKFDAKNAVVQDSGQRLAGGISVSGFGAKMVYQGDEVVATGKLYPTLGANQARMSYAEMKVVGRHPSLVAQLRRHFTAGMQSALPEPLASFGMGLLIGQKVTLPDNIYQDLLMVGLVHIIAVSGYNLTILLEAARKLLGNRSRRQTAILSIMLIGIFLLFTGSSASIVRAAIISLLSIVAGFYGRTFKPMVLIILAAAITAYANPFYVWTNASWYLSFLAFFGVLVLAPLVRERWLPARWKDSLVVLVGLESLCAEVMVLPYVLYTFGQISFISLLANILVVAFTPLAMLLSFVAGLAGMLAAPIAGWLAWPAVWLLNYMLDIAHLLARIPHVFAQNIGFSITQLLILYGVLSLMIFTLWHKTKGSKTVTITDEIVEE
jgi:competence protein ComEC